MPRRCSLRYSAVPLPPPPITNTRGSPGHPLELQTAELLVISAALEVIQGADVVAGEYLLRRAAALNSAVVNADKPVGQLLCHIDFVQRGE